MKQLIIIMFLLLSFNAFACSMFTKTVAGKTKLAIENYERSIELNPENVGGIEFLKKLKDKK